MKKLTPKQMKIASAAAPKDQNTGADFAELKKKQQKKKKKKHTTCKKDILFLQPVI